MRPTPRSALLLAALPAFACPVHATPIANWVVNGETTPISDAHTDGPTLGDGTNESAEGPVVSRFGANGVPETVTLNQGETLTVSVGMTFTGGSNSFGQIRLGVYDDGGQIALGSNNDFPDGWLHIGGMSLYKPANKGGFASFGRAIELPITDTTTGGYRGNSATAYLWTMSITRDSENTVDLISSIVGGDGNLNQTYTANDLATSAFTYNAVGILFGSSSSLDQVVFDNARFTVSDGSVPGDADGDGDIDDTDLGLAISNFTGPGGTGKTLADGDTDADGDVDDTDLGVAISGFTGPLSPAAVPEPASLALLGLGGLIVARRRRR